MDDVSFDAFVRNPSLYLTPPPLPIAGELVAWVKKRLEHGEYVTCGVSEAHRYVGQNQTLCLVTLPPDRQWLPSAAGLRLCRQCEALNRMGVTTIEEATAIAAKDATLKYQSVA